MSVSQIQIRSLGHRPADDDEPIDISLISSFQTEPDISRAGYFDGTRRSPRKMSRPQKHVCIESAVLNELNDRAIIGRTLSWIYDASIAVDSV